ncbi:MAG: ligase-associated DNA damage response endonuclease PdeM [Alphaproteobacteria bacterium]
MPFRFCAADLVADVSGALVWPAAGLIAVADLHLEKGSGFAARGALLPPYDTAATLKRLQALVARWRPRQVVCVGDSFHDRGAAERLDGGDAAAIAGLTAACDWVWVAGNHDPAPPLAWGGRVVGEHAVGPLRFRHEAAPRAAAGEISGHYHPKARVQVRGGRRSGRCFVADGRRMILPAFGAYTGGLDVLDPAIRSLLDRRFAVLLIGDRRVFPFGSQQLFRGA